MGTDVEVCVSSSAVPPNRQRNIMARSVIHQQKQKKSLLSEHKYKLTGSFKMWYFEYLSTGRVFVCCLLVATMAYGDNIKRHKGEVELNTYTYVLLNIHQHWRYGY